MESGARCVGIVGWPGSGNCGWPGGLFHRDRYRWFDYPAVHAQWGDRVETDVWQGQSIRGHVVGLDPGRHGAIATGRPFRGDAAGVMLYDALHRYGFASKPLSRHLRDRLQLSDCRITNAVKCLPPANKPVAAEVGNCQGYLSAELCALPKGGVILVLGGIAHQATIRALGYRLREYPFAHGAEHELPCQRSLLSSYHCSRYNTQTRRLTKAMFLAVVSRAKEKLGANGR